MSQEQHPIIPPPPHLLKKFSAQAQDEAKKRNGAGYLKTFATFCIEWAMNSKTIPNDRQIRSSEITPPPELVEQWECEYHHMTYGPDLSIFISEKAARWGADQELDACCEWLDNYLLAPKGAQLRAARRPKPLSLSEQAQQALGRFFANEHTQASQMTRDFEIIRQAVTRLQELEEKAND